MHLSARSVNKACIRQRYSSCFALFTACVEKRRFFREIAATSSRFFWSQPIVTWVADRLWNSRCRLREQPMSFRTREVKLARVFKFVDIFGYELHTIDDPQDKLPIPSNSQEISIGTSRMQVESVLSDRSQIPSVFYVRVRTTALDN